MVETMKRSRLKMSKLQTNPKKAGRIYAVKTVNRAYALAINAMTAVKKTVCQYRIWFVLPEQPRISLSAPEQRMKIVLT
jgi:hypothetical protein